MTNKAVRYVSIMECRSDPDPEFVKGQIHTIAGKLPKKWYPKKKVDGEIVGCKWVRRKLVDLGKRLEPEEAVETDKAREAFYEVRDKNRL